MVDVGGLAGVFVGRPSDYAAGLREAWLGEILGHAFFSTLATRFAEAPDQRRAIALMASVEADMSVVLGAALGAAADPAGAAQAARRGTAEAHSIVDWCDFVERVGPVTQPALDDYRALAAGAPAEHCGVLELLIEHELGLVRYFERANAGENPKTIDALDAIAGRLREAVQSISAAPSQLAQ